MACENNLSTYITGDGLLLRAWNHFVVVVSLLTLAGVCYSQSPQNANLTAHLDQLQTCREGILDAQARESDRIRWANMLLSYDTPDSQAMVVELLRWNKSNEVQRALSAVVADQARINPQRLIVDYVAPLMELLDSGDPALRTIAAQALADFPGDEIPRELGEVASFPDAPLHTRLAAIDALAPNTHRREVVHQLVELLDANVPIISQRVILALEPLAPQPFGQDPNRWRIWWQEKSRLSAEVWQAEQLRLYRDRSRQYSRQLDSIQWESERAEVALTIRIGQFQRELFRTVNQDQRDEKLNEWLNDDAFPIVQQTALEIIKTRINDEGYKPEGSVLMALLKLLREGTPSLRRESLGIVQNLNDTAVVTSVLKMLEVEEDPATRYTIFKALGRLDCVEAIPAFIREIDTADSSLECVREAANALGTVARKTEDGTLPTGTVDALKNRYERTNEGNAPMQSAILTAMAGVASPAFMNEFREAVESNDSTVLRPAIRGLVAVKDPSMMRRLRTLMAHDDPLVRLESIEAISQMGRVEVDLESLLTRMNPAIEPDDRVRGAAFNGFTSLLNHRSVIERIEAADRLRDHTNLQLNYLETLADSLSGYGDNTGNYKSVLHRLVSILETAGRFGEAVSHLRTLYDLSTQGQQNQRFNLGLQLLKTTLKSGTYTGIAALIRELTQISSSRVDIKRLTQTIQEYVDNVGPSNHKDRFRRLLAELQSIPTTGFGNAWSEMLITVASRANGHENKSQTP